MHEIEIHEIEEKGADTKKLIYTYETDSYYDLSIESREGAWTATLILKKFESKQSKEFESQLFEPYIENPEAFKCTYNGKDVAFMQLGFESWNKRMRVWELLVDSSYRKMNIGSKLFEHAKIVAKNAGARMIVLETQSCNTPAISFYLKQGFQLIGFDLAAYSNEDQEKNEVRLEFGHRL